MLCPEVWNFSSPPFSSSITNCNEKTDVLKAIDNQYFTHHVSITLPNTMKVPQNLVNILLEDNQFYRINEVPVAEFFTENFNDLFVRKGHLTGISIRSVHDRRDFFMITPNKKAVFVLSKRTYHELESLLGDTIKVYQSPQSICVFIDLSEETSHAEKMRDQIYKKLCSCSSLSFDVVLEWEPHTSSICPSSIAYYFSINGFNVKTCDVQYKQRHAYNVATPHIQDDSDITEIVEWLGVFNLECDLLNDSYLSTMKFLESHEVFGQVVHLTFTGLFNVSRVKKVISEISNMVTHSSTWINLVLQSFKGCHIKYDNKNYFQTSNNRLHSIFFRPAGSSVIYFYQDYKLIFD